MLAPFSLVSLNDFNQFFLHLTLLFDKRGIFESNIWKAVCYVKFGRSFSVRIEVALLRLKLMFVLTFYVCVSRV